MAEIEQERQSNESWHIAKIAKAIRESAKLDEDGEKYVTQKDLKRLIPGKDKLTEVFKPINGKLVPGGTEYFCRYRDRVSRRARVILSPEKPYVRAPRKPTGLLKENLLLKQELEELKQELKTLKTVKGMMNEAVLKSYDYVDLAIDGLKAAVKGAAGGAEVSQGGAGETEI